MDEALQARASSVALREEPRRRHPVAAISFVFDMQDMDQFQRFFFLFAFFLLGDLVTRHAERVFRTLREPRVFALLVAGSIGLVVLALMGMSSRYQLTSLPFACAGIGLAIVVFYLWRSYRFIDRLAFVGRHSLQAYILHWLFLVHRRDRGDQLRSRR